MRVLGGSGVGLSRADLNRHPQTQCTARLFGTTLRQRTAGGRKPCETVRADSYNGRPFSRSGTASQDLLEEVFSGLLDAVFPGNTTQSTLDMRLAVDLFEEDDYYAYYADIPGVKKDQLKVQAKEGLLTISGKRHVPIHAEGQAADGVSSRRLRRQERQAGKFLRQIVLPADADASTICAKVSDGVLKVTVFKVFETGPLEHDDVDIWFE